MNPNINFTPGEERKGPILVGLIRKGEINRIPLSKRKLNSKERKGKGSYSILRC